MSGNSPFVARCGKLCTNRECQCQGLLCPSHCWGSGSSFYLNADPRQDLDPGSQTNSALAMRIHADPDNSQT